MAQADITKSDKGSMSETIQRLSSKAGVQCTILMSSATGAIIQSTGTLAWSAATVSTSNNEPSAPISPGAEDKGLIEVARSVYGLVKMAGALVENVDAQDETKLLRLRTKKHELVIVPDAKFIFVVVHDTPSA